MSILSQNGRPFSEQCRAVAEGIRSVRAVLQEMVKEGHWPAGSFASMSTVIVSGLCVAKALERLANDSVSEQQPT